MRNNARPPHAPLDTEAGALWLLDDVQRQAGKRLQVEGRVVPKAFVMGRINPANGEPFGSQINPATGKLADEYGILTLDIGGEEALPPGTRIDQGRVIEWIGQMAEKSWAVGVIVLVYSWRWDAPGLSPEETLAEAERWAGRAHEKPG